VQSKREYFVSIGIIGVLFFIFGFFTWLNGTLIPFLKLACDLQSRAQSYLVTFAFYISYFIFALPSSWVLQRTGFKKGMAIGLLLMALGVALFIPAAVARSFGFCLFDLFVVGMGLALAQTACNPYISLVGPLESAARRISIMGICNKGAGVLSPLVLSAILLAGASEVEQQIKAATDPAVRQQLMQELSHRVIAPYAVMAVALAVVALIIWRSPLPELHTDGDDRRDDARSDGRTSVFQFPHLLLGVLCIFVYVGAEVMAGDIIGSYGQDLGLSLDVTKYLTAATLSSMLVGYVLGILTIPRLIKQETALKISALVGIAFTTLAFLVPGVPSIWFIALLGLANALMWPAIFPMAIDGLGRFTKTGSALLIMGIAGGAIVPQIYGRLLVPHLGAQTAFFWCTLPCYLYILFFAARGHRAGRARAATPVAMAAQAGGP
jgi:FHS family L-fucose permease-like MFS transporter